MSVQTATATSAVPDILSVIDSLEPGETSLFHGLSWDDYERLLDKLGDGYGVRVSFEEGELEIMAPLYRHESYKETITAMARILARACNLKLQAAGSTTLKLRGARRGAEPDTCFFIQHAEEMIGKESYDLQTDPPPDIVVEIDITSHTHDKRATYALFGVPEFWRYDGDEFEIFKLVDDVYVESQNSLTFSFVRASDMANFMEQSKIAGQDAALESFAKWVKRHKSPTV